MQALTRRDLLRLLGSGAAASLVADLPSPAFVHDAIVAARDARAAGREVRVVVTPVSPLTVRITVVDRAAVEPVHVPLDGSLVDALAHAPLGTSSAHAASGGLQVQVTEEPLTMRVSAPNGRLIQELHVDADTRALRFSLGDGPVFGLGEGGPQYDRRGAAHTMRSGQGGYQLRTHGGKVPVQWLLSPSGWAMFIHQPLGSFDLTGSEGRFAVYTPPPNAPAPLNPPAPLPLDLFVVDAADPVQAMAEYARLTGHPEMPPLWALGYQQSHRTLASRDEILGIAKTFREKKLPCDALIYLGTGFCPSGWNTENGAFEWNHRVFNDPKAILDEFHSMHFRAIVHVVILTRTLRGTARDACNLQRFDAEEVACYWNAHRKDFALGIDGWWPDEGDPLDAASRLTRNRMYYEAPQIDRPAERPYALHRNGHAGMQRYASFLWSGDVYSTWETLKTHVPNAINTALSGIPLWGTDTGGFVPTRDFTGELYVRWFQFSAFCPLFRSHGRDWKLRLPWGWNTGEIGPNEISTYGEAANPDPSELHNAQVEPICRKYLELRYRLLPYLYTAVRESHETGLPIIRALWLHYPGDATAVARGDEYLWGRDILVAPVTGKGATSKQVYLPKGAANANNDWYDFWTEERVAGGREITRAVDLATMPLYVRAGAILPFGPVKQYTSEMVNAPTTLVIYPGADGAYTLYEDDGSSFSYRKGDWMKTEIKWDDAAKKLALRLMPGPLTPPADTSLHARLRMLPRKFEVRLAGETATRMVEVGAKPVTLDLGKS